MNINGGALLDFNALSLPHFCAILNDNHFRLGSY